MRIGARLLLVTLLVLTPALAGCNFQDWYNQNGTVVIELVPQGPTNTSLTDFRSLKIAVYGVSVKQLLAANPKEFSYGESPLVVDFVSTGMRGERVPLATFKQNIRPVDSVTLRLDIVEAVDAQGRSLPVCREGSTEPTTFPCFFLPDRGIFQLTEPDFGPPRGGTVVFGFPLEVRIVTVRGDDEYFLLGDPADATIQLHR